MNYLLYLAYGAADIRSEALYSILSYYKVVAGPPATILVYTDAVEAFQQVLGEQYHLVYPAVTEAQWVAWRGSVNKVYLLKIGVLEHAALHYPGNLLFVDTDTIWQHDPAPLFEQLSLGQRCMHLNEGTLIHGNVLSRKVYRHLKGHHWQVGKAKVEVTAATTLYNSGAIGFRSQDVVVLPEVLRLAEELYAAYNKHMMEQLAFSLRFALDGPILEAAPYIVHYWNLKAARPLLDRAFNTYATYSLDAFYENASQLNLAMLHTSELAYRNLPAWRRTLLRLVGQRWKMPQL